MAAYGTFLITKSWHPLGVRALLRAMLRITAKLLSGNAELASDEEVLLISTVGKRRKERRAEMIVGLYLTFFGFATEAIGSVLWATDGYAGRCSIHFRPTDVSCFARSHLC